MNFTHIISIIFTAVLLGCAPGGFSDDMPPGDGDGDSLAPIGSDTSASGDGDGDGGPGDGDGDGDGDPASGDGDGDGKPASGLSCGVPQDDDCLFCLMATECCSADMVSCASDASCLCLIKCLLADGELPACVYTCGAGQGSFGAVACGISTCYVSCDPVAGDPAGDGDGDGDPAGGGA